MKTDWEIARSARLRPIGEIIAPLNIPEKWVIPYGRHYAKIHSGLLDELKGRPDGRLILVTSMSPTPEGEGKTTLTIGLAESLKLLGKKVVASIRQPSLGPFFGSKGGATGGGYAQVLPADDITVGFTGDDYAITTAHNLIASMIDNHLHQGNALGIDKDRITWGRASSVNDRALRNVVVSIGKGSERKEAFQISAASEVMSMLCLSRSLSELRDRVGRAITAFDAKGNGFTVKDLKVQGAAAAILRSAIRPNIVQSIEGVPVFVHGGPFGNISLGCSSLIATSMSLKLADYVLTEAGFATDLGAEKFFDIKCRTGSLTPSAAVILATLRSLRYHGGARDYKSSDKEAALRGLDNLRKHIENIGKFGVPTAVVINRYADDSASEIDAVKQAISKFGIPVYAADVRESGGEGGLKAAEGILRLCGQRSSFKPLYDLELSIADKITRIAVEIYGAAGVVFSDEAKKDIEEIERLGFGGLPVCVAKTHKSLSDDPALKGRPKGFRINVTRLKPAAGAGYIIAYCGQILLMPGLSDHPRAECIDVDGEGRITGC